MYKNKVKLSEYSLEKKVKNFTLLERVPI